MDYFNAGAFNDLNRMRMDSSFAPILNRNGGIDAAGFGSSVNGSFSALIDRARNSEIDSQSSESQRNPNIPPGVRDEKLYQLCLELETFLVKNLLSSMRNTVQRSGLIEQGFAGQIYEDMLFDEYAQTLTRNAGFGLAIQAYRQLSATQ